MKPFTEVTGIAVPFEQTNIDTDQIIPARYLKMPRGPDYHTYLFHDLRFGESGAVRRDFILNRPAFAGGTILVASSNFGCGSSREAAVYALDAYGVRVVIAPSFADIFYNNCLKNGLLAVRLDERSVQEIQAALAATPGLKLHVSLVDQSIEVEGGKAWRFEMDPQARERLLAGLDDIGSTLTLEPEIDAFAARYRERFPWLTPNNPARPVA